MPILEINTTFAASFFPADFLPRLAETGATIFKRRRRGMVTFLNTDRQLFSGESGTDPVFLMRVFNVDSFKDADENREIIKKLFEFLTSEIGVPDESIRILLQSEPASNVGMPGGMLLPDYIKEMEKNASASGK